MQLCVTVRNPEGTTNNSRNGSGEGVAKGWEWLATPSQDPSGVVSIMFLQGFEQSHRVALLRLGMFW